MPITSRWQLVCHDWLWTRISQTIEIQRNDQQRDHRNASLRFTSFPLLDESTGEFRSGEIERLRRFWFTGRFASCDDRTRDELCPRCSRRVQIECRSTIATEQSETRRKIVSSSQNTDRSSLQTLNFTSAFLLLFGGTLIAMIILLCENAYARFLNRTKRSTKRRKHRRVSLGLGAFAFPPAPRVTLFFDRIASITRRSSISEVYVLWSRLANCIWNGTSRN